jgi:peptidoglycan hydrolase-like protein with peptidoglycan-binding domain
MSSKVNKKITIHHMAGNLSVETCGNVFARSSAKASSNYGIDSNGRIGLYVNECDRSWASSSSSNDSQAVTIEVANNSGAPNWSVGDKAYAALIDLCEDICRRNNIKSLNYTGDSSGNLTMHNFFAATTCPGPYLKARFKNIADEVNKRLGQAPVVKPTRDESVPVDGYYHCTKGKDTKLSENFTSTEFDCNGSGCCTETIIDVDLVKYLQKIRTHFNKPLTITSAYRCKKHNAAVANASSQSKHMYGMAADFYISGVATTEIAKYAESIGVLGIGLYPAADGNFVHIDTRTTKSFWYGHAGAYRSTYGGGNTTDADTVLNQGDKGDRVKKLQQDLKDLGYKISVDSVFGKQTKAAVEQFQVDMGLSKDGIVGPATDAAIKKALEAKNSIGGYDLEDFVLDVQRIIGAEPDGIAGKETLDKTVTISAKINNRHALVKPIQKRLAAMGYTEVGDADGAAGSMFTKAVKRLQKEKGKVQDGEITKGCATWKLLLGMM